MNRMHLGAAVAVGALAGGAAVSAGGVITAYADRPTFNAAAIGLTQTVEPFTGGSHFPIPNGTLNSTTTFTPPIGKGSKLNAGDILPGVTYAATLAEGNYFNIDAGGGTFVGGFLDGVRQESTDLRGLTATFDTPQRFVGFDTTANMSPAFTLQINFSTGPAFVGTYAVTPASGLQFFGWQSVGPDITSIQLSSTNSSLIFAMDNFTFAVPEPAALGGVGIVAGLLGRRRRAG